MEKLKLKAEIYDRLEPLMSKEAKTLSDFAERIEPKTQMENDWIECENKMPDRQGEYLVFSPVHYYTHNGVQGKIKIKNRSIGSYCIGNYTGMTTGFYINSIHYPDVTHWQPLPAYPNTEEDSNSNNNLK